MNPDGILIFCLSYLMRGLYTFGLARCYVAMNEQTIIYFKFTLFICFLFFFFCFFPN